MRTILAPVDMHTHLQSVLKCALPLSRLFGSYIEGLALDPDISNIYAADSMMLALPILDEGSRENMVAEAHYAFEGFMHEHQRPECFGEPTSACIGWQGDILHRDASVGELARAFDITVVGRPTSDGAGPRRATLEQVLVESGRPVLVAPPLPPSVIGRNVVIAWNGSTGTARSISFAMPLLHKAETVTVLTIKGATVPGPTGAQIARTLRSNGVAAQALDVNDGSRHAGEAILTNARALGADLLVKGAYTRSRLRQLVFGGSTSYVLEHATLPMIIAH
jgi:nucleotide-binding universal stress UspA family protein